MRRLTILLLMAAIGLPVSAAKPVVTTMVTVAQLEQALTAAREVPDKKLAKQIADMKLTERLSDASFARLKELVSGPNAQVALLAIADESAFLNLPPAEIPPLPKPDHNAQIALLNKVMDYLASTVPKLPDLVATRELKHFEGTSLVVPKYERDVYLPDLVYSPYQRLSLLKTTTATLRYSGGLETYTDPHKGYKAECYPGAITGTGEFGELLARVALEVTKGQIVWSHWEQGAAGPMAVFEYRALLTYTFQRHCPGEGAYLPVLVDFHGEITADPADGSIRRLIEIKRHKDVLSWGVNTADTYTMAEFGPEEIGGSTYICTQKSVVLSRWKPLGMEVLDTFDRTRELPNTLSSESLRHGEYSHYHLFRSESHIVTGPIAKPGTPPVAPVSPHP